MRRLALALLLLTAPAVAKPAGAPLCFRSSLSAYPNAVWSLNFMQVGQAYLIAGFVDWNGFRYVVGGTGSDHGPAIVETDLGGNFQRSYINWNSLSIPIPGTLYTYDYYHLYEETAYAEVHFRYDFSPLTSAACP
jgi:hypothetical protein